MPPLWQYFSRLQKRGSRGHLRTQTGAIPAPSGFWLSRAVYRRPRGCGGCGSPHQTVGEGHAPVGAVLLAAAQKSLADDPGCTAKAAREGDRPFASLLLADPSWRKGSAPAPLGSPPKGGRAIISLGMNGWIPGSSPGVGSKGPQGGWGPRPCGKCGEAGQRSSARGGSAPPSSAPRRPPEGPLAASDPGDRP
jgi:hypothetical protein